MNLLKKKDYISPDIEIILVDVEIGYSVSGNEDENGGGISLPDWGFI